MKKILLISCLAVVTLVAGLNYFQTHKQIRESESKAKFVQVDETIVVDQPVMSFAVQTDSTVSEEPTPPVPPTPAPSGWTPKDWILAAIALIGTLIPTVAWGKAKYRVGKFVALGQVFTEAIKDNKIDANELVSLNKAFQDLIGKEEA